MGTSLDDLRAFPPPVRESVGYALWLAQNGGKAPAAKPLKGFRTGAGVVQVSDRYGGEAYRVVYLTGLTGAVYVLHAWRKKSPTGIRTSRRDVQRIRTRLDRALSSHEEEFG